MQHHKTVAAAIFCSIAIVMGGCASKQSSAVEDSTSYCKLKGNGIVDGAIIIRGGYVNAHSLAEGGGVGVDGKLTDLSVNSSGDVSAPNTAANRNRYRAGIPNAHYGVTSAKKVCQAGGYLMMTPNPGNEYHCTLWGITPKKAASLFTQY